ncbi:hypothetical protein Ocin01_08422 [Orchesella cincta]|uniref:Uncharacterized protein n=1 Tax=Orchesella cincta TaxID=48709 RepID=A0A1D2N028_ORCCI|nr:hypothetical protein Ocin01_08422 [Orchesella cincta]
MTPHPVKDDENQQDSKNPKKKRSIEDSKKNVVKAINELSDLDNQLTGMSKAAGKPAAPRKSQQSSTVHSGVTSSSNRKTVVADSSRRQTTVVAASMNDPPKKKTSVQKIASRTGVAPPNPSAKPAQNSKNLPQPTPSKAKAKTVADISNDTPTAKPKDSKLNVTHKEEKDTKHPVTSMNPVNPVRSSVKRRTYTSTDDETLSKRQYGDEQLLAVPSASEREAAQNWVERKIDLVLILDTVLTIVAAFLTSLACYTLFRLPSTIYSAHILMEIFLGSDTKIGGEGFQRGPGLHIITPLPSAITIMYIFCLYVVYMMQYPKSKKIIQIFRYCVIGIIDTYLVLCVLSYLIGMTGIETRMDNFFELDMKAFGPNPIMLGNGRVQEPFHFLSESQFYASLKFTFSCCGFTSNLDWQILNASTYTGVWPLSCCDAKGSGIGCYFPVYETITYVVTWDQENDDRSTNVTRDRLFKPVCKDQELAMSYTVSTLTVVAASVFIGIAIWVSVLVCKITHLITKYNIVIKEKPQYIDFL